ncbi:MAG: glycosyl hydrolase [Deltaproteobacteria bacterium]|nr:glycosyl hydrolase [Deltaproteobacteria bacterium]
MTLWREPILCHPVLIIESDDWGPGPAAHIQQLNRLIELLSVFRDCRGRHPRMTLGVVLAVPDSKRIRKANLRHYYRLRLSGPRFAGIREAMNRGVASGVFTLQLHGMEHFWPPAILKAAAIDSKIKEWITCNGPPNTEDLPSYLQSRWTDASSLPSRPIPAKEIELAAKEEVAEFTRTFGYLPRVAVPPTFVWNPAVEKAWGAAGIEVIVAPGHRSETRAFDGKPRAIGAAIHNGQRSLSGPMYIVRDQYFEPALGHTAERALNAVAENTRMGRPTLLETHRFNFTGDPAVAESSFEQFEVFFTEALTRYPDINFTSTEELAQGLRKAESNLLEARLISRIHVWLQRLYEVPRLRKLACLSGLIVPAFLMFLATKQHRRPDPKTSALSR